MRIFRRIPNTRKYAEQLHSTFSPVSLQRDTGRILSTHKTHLFVAYLKWVRSNTAASREKYGRSHGRLCCSMAAHRTRPKIKYRLLK
jgi:hypothetical protein